MFRFVLIVTSIMLALDVLWWFLADRQARRLPSRRAWRVGWATFMTVQAAGDEVINRKLKAVGGEGGVIIVDAKGNIATPFNSEGMYRGWIGADGQPVVAIYK